MDRAETLQYRDCVTERKKHSKGDEKQISDEENEGEGQETVKNLLLWQRVPRDSDGSRYNVLNL